MGNKSSSTQKQLTEVITKNTTNYLNTNKTVSNTSNINRNEYILNLQGAKIKNCDIGVEQRIQADQATTTIAKSASLTDFKNDLSAIAESSMKSQDKTVNSFLSTAFGNSTNRDVEVKNIIRNEIEQNITNENLTECNAILDNYNKGVLNMEGAEVDCSDKGSIGAPQEIISKQVSNCYSDALAQALSKNTQISQALNEMDVSTETTNRGLGEGIADATKPLLDTVSGVFENMSTVTMVIIVVSIIIFGGGGIYLSSRFFSSDSDTQQNVMQLASNANSAPQSMAPNMGAPPSMAPNMGAPQAQPAPMFNPQPSYNTMPSAPPAQPAPMFNTQPIYNPMPSYNPMPNYNPTMSYNPQPQYNLMPMFNPQPQYMYSR